MDEQILNELRAIRALLERAIAQDLGFRSKLIHAKIPERDIRALLIDEIHDVQLAAPIFSFEKETELSEPPPDRKAEVDAFLEAQGCVKVPETESRPR